MQCCPWMMDDQKGLACISRTLKVNVAVLELFQKMLIDQVIHKHLERSGLDQTTGMDSIRHQPDLQVLKWIGLLTLKRRLQF